MRRNPLKKTNEWLLLPGAKFFSNDALELAIEECDFGSRFTVVAMTPTDFLRMALDGRDEEKQVGVNELLAQGIRFRSMLRLMVDVESPDVARCVGHEGRHRARALKAAGVGLTPIVMLVRNNLRWSDGPRLPRVLRDEDGKDSMPFPKSEVWVP